MARLARVVAPGTAHHITQRGNARRFILDCDVDRLTYLQLLSESCQLHQMTLVGYCLMSNHVHLVGIPQREDSLGRAMKRTHGQYAAYFNARHLSSGHVWQGRFYSCPLDDHHLWAALRYTELNPVRAGMAGRAEDYRWSSAAVHCGKDAEFRLVDLEPWRQVWSESEWREALGSETSEAEARTIRRYTHTGRPLGSVEFVSRLEETLGRRLVPIRGGRRLALPDASRQECLFGA